jgi:S1-C subfamily serine protease
VVEWVVAGSPAAAAGMRPGDVIVALDGMPIVTPRAFALAIADHPTEAIVRLGVLIEGRQRRVAMLLGGTAASDAVPRRRSSEVG